MARSIRAMPEKEKPPAMRVDLYCAYIPINIYGEWEISSGKLYAEQPIMHALGLFV